MTWAAENQDTTVLLAGRPMDEGLIQVRAMATRAACVRMTTARLRTLHDSVQHASCLRDRSPWDRRAGPHAEIFVLLADMTDDPVLAPVPGGAADLVHQLVLAAGPAAEGMIVRSGRRLLECMRAGAAEGAALEMERHLRGLYFMPRLIGDHPETAVIPRLLTADLPAGVDRPGPPPGQLTYNREALAYGATRMPHYLPTNLSAREIAGELYLSVNTVKTHQRHLYQKLSARSCTQVERARTREQRRLWRADLRGLAAPAANIHWFRPAIPGRPSMRYR